LIQKGTGLRHRTIRIISGKLLFDQHHQQIIHYIPLFLNEDGSFDEGEHDDMLDADDIVRRLILNPNEYVELPTW
jgi:hypothetical protein